MNDPGPKSLVSLNGRFRFAVAVVLALVVLWGFFLRNALRNDRSFALLMDNEFFIGTVLSSISNSLARGEWPLRMDTVLGGMPLYNFPQLSPFYPFYFASLPIFATPLEVVHSMHWITLAHLLVLEINMYVFLRVAGASRIASLTGAAAFAFGMNSLTYAVWLNITAPYAWFPLFLAGIIGTFKQPGRTTYQVLALVGIVLVALASPAQPLIHAVMVSAVFVAAHWLSHGFVDGWHRTRRPLLLTAATGLVAFLLVAPVIIPAMLEFKNMIRWVGPFPPVVGNDPIPFAAFQIDQLPSVKLLGVLFNFGGAAVGSPFVGLVTVALALVAVVGRRRHWVVSALAFVAIYSLMSSAGSNLGFAYINHHIPLLNKIREPSRFLVLFQFSVAALAALGLDVLRRRSEEGPRSLESRRLVAVLLAVAAIGAGTAFSARDHIDSILPPWISLLALVALILATTQLGRWSSSRRGIVVILLWAASALILLALEVKWMPAPLSASKYNTDGGQALDRVFDRLQELDPQREYRVIFDGKIDKQMASMQASYRGIRTLNAYFNPAPLRQFEELYYHGPRTANYFQALGAKFLVCDQCAPQSMRGYSYLESVDGMRIYSAENVLPHSRSVTRIDGSYVDMADFAARVSTADLRKGLLYVRQEDAGLLAEGTRSDCASQETRRSTNRMRIVVTCTSPSVLVVNEYFDPAWQVKVNGHKGHLLKVNGTQMAAQVPVGSNVVDFIYRPRALAASIPLALLGLLLIVFAALFRGKKVPWHPHAASVPGEATTTST